MNALTPLPYAALVMSTAVCTCKIELNVAKKLQKKFALQKPAQTCSVISIIFYCCSVMTPANHVASNTPIPRPTPLTTPNCIRIQSAVLPQFTFADRQMGHQNVVENTVDEVDDYSASLQDGWNRKRAAESH